MPNNNNYHNKWKFAVEVGTYTGPRRALSNIVLSPQSPDNRISIHELEDQYKKQQIDLFFKYGLVSSMK